MKTAFYVVQLLLASSILAKQSSASSGLKPMYIPGFSFCEAEDELFADNLIQEKQDITGLEIQREYRVSNQKSSKNLVQSGKPVAQQEFTFNISIHEDTSQKFLAQNEVELLSFNHTGKDILDLTDKIIADNLSQIQAVVDVKGPRTFENTIVPIAKYEWNYGHKTMPMMFYKDVSTSDELREASRKAAEKLEAFEIQLSMRDDYYNAIKAYKEEAQKDGQWDKLSKIDKRYVEQCMQDFELNGLSLPKETRVKLQQIQKEIGNMERVASQNINEDKTKVEVEEKLLKGMPEHIIKNLEKVPGKEGFRFVSMKKTEINPALKLVQDEKTRERLSFAMGNKAVPANSKIVEEIVAKRHEMALMLGHSSYSQYTLMKKMAKNPMNVQKFEEDLTKLILEKGHEEKQEMIQFKKDLTGDPNAVIHNWDGSFYGNLFLQKNYKIESEKIREFFPMENVVAQTLDIYQTLLGLKFSKLKDASTWHPEVQAYQVADSKSGEVMGQFYLDLFPRDNKYGHAAAFPLQQRAQVDGKIHLPAAAMVTNFDKPTADKPSLMSHGEVVTFFHEFGHVMHNMCTESTYSRFSGTSVENDFVELPSQMLENWMWDKDVLKKVSKHYKTGEQMPDAMVDTMMQIKNLNQASSTLGQIFLGTFDFLFHSANDATLLKAGKALTQVEKNGYNLASYREGMVHEDGFKVDSMALWSKLKTDITGMPEQEGTNPVASFDHIIGGYASTYYGYLWSKVYSAELFNEFEQKGLLNPEVGMKYRKIILSHGGSRDSIESLVEFLGREPNQDAFLQQSGFKEKPKTALHQKK